MSQQLSLYREQIDGQPPCVASLFRENLQKYRVSDEDAARWIFAICLRIAFEVATTMELPHSALKEIERIEEANAGLWMSIDSFAGVSAEEFTEHARKHILARLETWRGKAA